MRMHAVAGAIVLVAVVTVGGACSGGNGTTSSVPWELRSAVDSSTSVIPITVYVGSSSCDRFETAEVDESADAVTITAMIHSSGAEACSGDMRLRPVEVELSSPLGDRALLGCGERPGYQGESRDCRMFPSP